MKTEINGNDVTFTRRLKAKRERVFDAWTDPRKVESWWGCAQTTSVRSTIELHVGGRYHHDMTLEGGHEYPVAGIIDELIIPEKLVYTVQCEPMEGFKMPAQITTTVLFIEDGDETEIRLTMSDIADSGLKDIVGGGWAAAFEKLEKQIEN